MSRKPKFKRVGEPPLCRDLQHLKIKSKNSQMFAGQFALHGSRKSAVYVRTNIFHEYVFDLVLLRGFVIENPFHEILAMYIVPTNVPRILELKMLRALNEGASGIFPTAIRGREVMNS